MPNNDNFGKKILLDFIDFLRYKVENDKISVGEIEEIAKMLNGSLHLYGTAEDFAEFYGKSKDNVRVVINRRMLSKPIRKVLYPFNTFRKVIPNTWSHKEE